MLLRWLVFVALLVGGAAVYGQQQAPTKPTDAVRFAPAPEPTKPWYLRTEVDALVIAGIGVLITSVISLLTLREIRRQADYTASQAGYMSTQTGRMARQADLMNRQTKIEIESLRVAREAADAALLNAQAVVDAGRARILFEVQKDIDLIRRGVGVFTIFAVNYGNVPAEIISYGEPTEFCEAPNNRLPIPPAYPDAVAPKTRYLLPESRHPVGKFTPSAPGTPFRLMQSLPPSDPPSSLHDCIFLVFGEVKYKDGFSPEIHHSRYCFRFNREPFSNIGGALEEYGPPEYSQWT